MEFHAACVYTRGLPELFRLPVTAHLVYGILCHIRRHGSPISTVPVMMPSDLCQAQRYGYHGSSLHDTAFVRAKLAAQTDMVHTILLQ